MLAAPAGESAGSGWKVQRSTPVFASKARTSPDVMSRRLLSAIDEPTMTRSRYTTGGDVSDHSPFHFGGAPQALVERDLAADAEPVARPAVGAHQAGEPRVRRAGVDAIAGHHHAAVGEVAVVQAAVDGEVDPPRLGAGVGIECNHQSARRRQVEPAVDVHRRRLEGGLPARRRHRLGRLARVVAPRLDETTDVLRRQPRRGGLRADGDGGEQKNEQHSHGEVGRW